MSKDQKDSKGNFSERTKNHRVDKAIAITNEFLAVMKRDDIPYHDIHYIIQRAKEILEEKYKSIKFSNEIIHRERMEFLGKQAIKAQAVRIPIAKDADTKQRRCESLSQELVSKVLSLDVLLSDQDYYKDVIENDDLVLNCSGSFGYVDAIWEQFLIAVSLNSRLANKKLWKGKEEEEVTWKDLDDVLNKTWSWEK